LDFQANNEIMVYLIHGQNQVDSRRFLIRLKSNYKNIEVIPGKHLNEKNFLNKIRGYSHPLFGGKTAFLVEEFDGNWSVLPKKDLKEIDIILWSGKKLDVKPTMVKSFLFDQQRNLTAFKLVDAVLLKDEREALVILYGLLKKKEPPEKIIGALSRGFSLIYCAKEGSLGKAKMPSFALQRLKDQERFWNKLEIKKAFLELLRADVSLKSGQESPSALITVVSKLSSKSLN